MFLPVVAQHTERIGLGTAIIGMRYEDPILLAEAAGTADLLTDGRLQLGLSTGMGGFDVAFGQEPGDGRAQSQARLRAFLRGIRGERVGEVNEPAGPLTAGTGLTVRGASPSLPERVWYGAGSIESARRVAGQGLRLLMSTILTGRIEDYNAHQAAAIAAYRAAHVGPRPPRVAVSRSILPATSPDAARLYAAYDRERRALGPGASRPAGALTATDARPAPAYSVSPAIHGDPEHVAERLLQDPAVRAADELIAFLPPAFDRDQNARLIADIAETVGPRIGWEPGAAATAVLS